MKTFKKIFNKQNNWWEYTVFIFMNYFYKLMSKNSDTNHTSALKFTILYLFRI